MCVYKPPPQKKIICTDYGVIRIEFVQALKTRGTGTYLCTPPPFEKRTLSTNYGVKLFEFVRALKDREAGKCL